MNTHSTDGGIASPSPAPAQAPALGVSGGATAAGFATTHWTVVVRASGGEMAGAREALEELCRVYWRPLYAFVRRRGNSPHDSQDLTQGFFVQLLGRDGLAGLDPGKGRFRSFLLAAMKNFLANEGDRARALKRGGGVVVVSFDSMDSEVGVEAGLAAGGLDAEQAYDRQWALAVLDRVLERLREESRAAGKGTQFEALKETLTGERGALPYTAIGLRLGMTEGAVKVAVHRLRQRYRQLLQAEVARTVSEPGLVAEELRELWAALAASPGGRG